MLVNTNKLHNQQYANYQKNFTFFTIYLTLIFISPLVHFVLFYFILLLLCFFIFVCFTKRTNELKKKTKKK